MPHKVRHAGYEVERLSHDSVVAEHTFRAINSPVAAGRQRSPACASRMPAPARCWRPSSCSGNSRTASAQPTCAAISWPCRPAMHALSPKAPHVERVTIVNRFLEALAGILRSESADLTIFLNDVWSFWGSARITSALFGNPRASPAPRLLVTLLDTNAVDLFLRDPSVELDPLNEAGESTFDRDFARQVTAAWSALEQYPA